MSSQRASWNRVPFSLATAVLMIGVGLAAGPTGAAIASTPRPALAVAAASDEAPFTIAVIPDTQNYTYAGREAVIRTQAQWIADSRTRLNTAFTVQVGDLVSDYWKPAQWTAVSDGLAALDQAGVPYSVVPGNHDFDNSTGVGDLFHTSFPVSRFAGASWNSATTRYGGYYGQGLYGPDPEDRGNMNSFSLFRAGGTDFLVLNLEWEAGADALAWGRRVLAAHPDRVAILVTHSFINDDGTRRAVAERPGGTSQLALWNDFVRSQCTVKLVISGHEHNGDAGEAARTDPNSCGQPVHQLLTDYQSRANGGNGWLRYYTFDPGADTMTATTYSPTLDMFETDADSSFTLPFALGPASPPPSPGFRDSFTRTASSGWGAADIGGTWTPASNAGSFSVDGTNGRIVVDKGKSRSIRSTSFTSAASAIASTFSISPAPSGSGSYVSVIARSSGTSDYRATVNAAAAGTTLSVRRMLNGVETSLASFRIGGPVAAGTAIKVKFEATGSAPTTLRAKAWTSGGEPSGWQVSATDASAALQSAGAAGVFAYVSSGAASASIVSVADFSAEPDGVAPPNQAPSAAIAPAAITERTVGLDGSASTDPDGSIVSYAWRFGDGATASGATTTHTYAADGTYAVELTVTDDGGLSATTSLSVAVVGSPPANEPPTAVFAPPSVVQRTVDVRGSGSVDADGAVVGFAWDFGDGAVATTSDALHTYAADGTYTIRLTVTDDDGATATVTRAVTIDTSGPTGTVLADDFARTVSSGWGTTAAGAAWSHTSSASRYAVADGSGQHRLATAGASAESSAGGAPASNTEIRVDVSWDRTSAAGTLYAGVSPRAVDASSEYRAKVIVTDGVPSIEIVRRVGGAETRLGRVSLPTSRIAVDTWYTVAVRAISAGGTTTVSAKIWPRGAAEPGVWQVSATDATPALQQPGRARLWTYRSTSSTAAVTTRFDNIAQVIVP